RHAAKTLCVASSCLASTKPAFSDFTCFSTMLVSHVHRDGRIVAGDPVELVHPQTFGDTL
ncbi:MAG: hypothetical protein WCK21_06390, partial [Actinomycetota bacterium]